MCKRGARRAAHCAETNRPCRAARTTAKLTPRPWSVRPMQANSRRPIATRTAKAPMSRSNSQSSPGRSLSTTKSARVAPAPATAQPPGASGHPQTPSGASDGSTAKSRHQFVGWLVLLMLCLTLIKLRALCMVALPGYQSSNSTSFCGLWDELMCSATSGPSCRFPCFVVLS